MNSIVTYETFHGSAKKIAQVIAEKLDCKCINIDTPFEAENLKDIKNIIFVFNFRGPYTAQLTKLYMSRVKDQLREKNVILVGEGLFSEKEFPIVADEINRNYPSKTFNKFFVNGQLRVDVLFPEEIALLNKAVNPLNEILTCLTSSVTANSSFLSSKAIVIALS